MDPPVSLNESKKESATVIGFNNFDIKPRWANSFAFLLTLSGAIFWPLPKANGAPTSLTVQDVITMTLQQSLSHKDINLGYQKSEIARLLAASNFETSLVAKVQTEDSKAETVGVMANERDQTQSWILGVNRKFSTGSTLGLDYSFLHRESDLSTFAINNNVNPTQYYHLTTLNFKQELLNNGFGYRDRRLLLSADLQFQRSKLERDETIEELVLQSIRLYLDTYFAQENLKQSLAAKEKYLLLLKSIQQKNKMGFDDRSELIKTKAEVQNQERNVKSATLTYQNLVQKLYTLLNTPLPEEVIIAVPESSSSLAPSKAASSIENLRKSKSSQLLIQATEAESEASQNSEWVGLNFFAQAAYSGLDSSRSPAFSEMKDRENPKYTLGLEFFMAWGASAQKAEKLSKYIAHEEALNTQKKIKNDLMETIDRTERNLKSRFDVMTQAQETVKIWEDAMKSQERNHRYGHITTAELIMDYTSYFRAKASLSGAIADYQMSLYEYQAARDELITSKD